MNFHIYISQFYLAKMFRTSNFFLFVEIVNEGTFTHLIQSGNI